VLKAPGAPKQLSYLLHRHREHFFLSCCRRVRAQGLRHLLLGDNPSLGDAGAVSIAAALHRHASLATLRLKGCGLKRPSAIALAAALRFNSNLATLDLAENAIGAIQ